MAENSQANQYRVFFEDGDYIDVQASQIRMKSSGALAVDPDAGREEAGAFYIRMGDVRAIVAHDHLGDSDSTVAVKHRGS